jgi:hypothetical protein
MDRTTSAALQRNLYWIAILPLLLLPVGAWLMLSFRPGGQPVPFWTGLALFVAAIPVFWVAMGSRYYRVTIGSKLDERELALFYRTSAAAYRIYAIITVLGCFYLQLAQTLGAPMPAPSGWICIMGELGNLFTLLPIIILEWSPDPLASEEEE